MTKYIYNKNAFNKIVTEEDAYWLGFILADGYVSHETQKPLLQIKLGAKDKEHLNKFIKYLQYNSTEVIKTCVGGSYNRDNLCYVFKNSCKNIVKNLYQYGMNGAKSTKERPYILSNIDLQKAYIRGIFDGDGFIQESENTIGLVGSLEVVTYVRNFINDNICKLDREYIYQHGSIYKFKISVKDKVKQILDFLYKNANIYLDRKYILYKENYC